MGKSKLIEGHKYVEFEGVQLNHQTLLEKSSDFYKWINKRRTVRDFSSKPIPREVIINIVKAASCAPSGANKQPWTYCVIESASIKKKVREAAEEEEKVNYSGRMSESWLKDLEHLGTNAEKPFLETAPYLIVIFKKVYDIVEGEKLNNYYVNESVGLSAGFLLNAIHNLGLVALTHTPSPMNFLTKILDRPANEKPYLLIPVGYPADEVYVPDIERKKPEDYIKFY